MPRQDRESADCTQCARRGLTSADNQLIIVVGTDEEGQLIVVKSMHTTVSTRYQLIDVQGGCIECIMTWTLRYYTYPTIPALV